MQDYAALSTGNIERYYIRREMHVRPAAQQTHKLRSPNPNPNPNPSYAGPSLWRAGTVCQLSYFQEDVEGPSDVPW